MGYDVKSLMQSYSNQTHLSHTFYESQIKIISGIDKLIGWILKKCVPNEVNKAREVKYAEAYATDTEKENDEKKNNNNNNDKIILIIQKNTLCLHSQIYYQFGHTSEMRLIVKHKPVQVAASTMIFIHKKRRIKGRLFE